MVMTQVTCQLMIIAVCCITSLQEPHMRIRKKTAVAGMWLSWKD